MNETIIEKRHLKTWPLFEEHKKPTPEEEKKLKQEELYRIEDIFIDYWIERTSCGGDQTQAPTCIFKSWLNLRELKEYFVHWTFSGKAPMNNRIKQIGRNRFSILFEYENYCHKKK